MITAVIADDHEVVRRGVRLIFEASPDVRVVGEAGTGDQAVEQVLRHHPDVLILDLRMPGMGGPEVIKAVKAAAPATRVLVLTGIDSPPQVLSAVEAGADGYSLKEMSAAQLQEAVRAVGSGNAYLHPSVAGQVMAAARRSSQVAMKVPWGLSPRELEVLRLMGLGLDTDQIAGRLFIGQETVRSHVKAVLRKMGRRNRLDAVMAAIGAGIIELGQPAGETKSFPHLGDSI